MGFTLPGGGYYLSAYGIAVKHGFVGSEEEWNASVNKDRLAAEAAATSAAASQTAAAKASVSATAAANTASTAADKANAAASNASAIGSNLTNVVANEIQRAKSEEQRIENLFVKPTQEAVDTWLTAHPEATTTVVDGSLTEEKFSDALKLTAINNYITPQAYHTDADGDNWDTAIQAAVDYIVSQKDSESIPLLCFPSGIYKIYNTITLPNYVKIKALGRVVFETYVEGAAFKWKTTSETALASNTENYYSISGCNLIDGTNGTFLFLNKSTSTNTVGISFNDEDSAVNNGMFRITHNCVSNCVIIGYTYGIKIYLYNYYIDTFRNVWVGNCSTGIWFSTSAIDSGEKIVFDDCTIANCSDIAVDNNNANFSNCSFDYNYRCINGSGNFVNCHFEGIGYLYNTESEEPVGDDAYLMKYSSSNPSHVVSHIVVRNCDCVKFAGVTLFQTTAANCYLHLDNFKLLPGGRIKEYNNKSWALASDNFTIVSYTPNISYYATFVPQDKLNLQVNPEFENIDAQVLDGKPSLDGYYWLENDFGAFTTHEITTTKQFSSGGKSLKFASPSGGAYTKFFTKQNSCRGGDLIYATFRMYLPSTNDDGTTSSSSIVITPGVRFYDADGNIISASHPIVGVDEGWATYERDKWFRAFRCLMAYAPINAASYRVSYEINPYQQSTFYLTDFYFTNIGILR